jgi:2-succinyl-5-enolpyruvyl-6-hydroxy-3-cyclohexene-1-carboxylate synthase
MIPLQILQWARFCKEAGILHFFASPGSRSAPLVLALQRLGGFEINMVMDERSCAYQALGYARASGSAVGVFCTSGTAVLNLGPAIAEAFYLEQPLFIFSADRPPEWIDQQEGQAIRQTHVFQAHVRFSGTLPIQDPSQQALQHSLRILRQAYFAAFNGPVKGPVHLNIPIREPFYPESGETLVFPTLDFGPLHISSSRRRLEREDLSPLIELWNKTSKRLLVVGQSKPWLELANACKALSEYGNVPVAGDFLNNLHLDCADGRIVASDGFSKTDWSVDLVPDILITMGGGLLSKPLKQFLAAHTPKEHWHISPDQSFPPDPFMHVTRMVMADPAWFLTRLGESSYFSGQDVQEEAKRFFSAWISKENNAQSILQSEAQKSNWDDMRATAWLMNSLPSEGILFAGNSMSVRYASWFAKNIPPNLVIQANRGTSGIDGCLSSAVGMARAIPGKPVIILLGDMGFFYDRNALWGNGLPPNLKIMVLNNAGGNIFRILPQSGKLPELESHFEMHQPFEAESASKEAGLAYFRAENLKDMHDYGIDFLQFKGPALLECLTNGVSDAEAVASWKSLLNG